MSDFTTKPQEHHDHKTTPWGNLRTIRRSFLSGTVMQCALLTILVLATAPLALSQQASISGAVVDTSGALIARAQVKLSFDNGGPAQSTLSGQDGSFTFSNATPGPFHVSFAAKGFAPRNISGEVHPGESLSLPQTVLVIADISTEVTVTQTQAELAQTQIKAEEQQRLIGILPNYFVTYESNPAPLNNKQKFELTWKSYLDPSGFVINGIIAGVWQAQNTYPGFHQGAEGYAKRYGASFADYGTSLAIEKFVMPTFVKQDPRYFYKGVGTKRSRFLYAISRSVICQGDNGRPQVCYSTLASGFGTGFIVNYYYPAADRNSTAVNFENGAIGIGGNALGNLFQEFIARKITRKRP